ncbi:intestinal mucin-like protein [Osmerus mordax]|uniref:intestinal mucin-like protein n=1 Tax=Osmerus mordax TaxID=8014 RepID=UPI003510BDE8
MYIPSSPTAFSTPTTTNHTTVSTTTAATEVTIYTTEPTTPNTPSTPDWVTTTATTIETTTPGGCVDQFRNQSWLNGQEWKEECSTKICKNGKIEVTPILCPQTTVPSCPRGQAVKVKHECCEFWECNCRCDVYGDPHYISFQGVTYDFLDNCTYILVEERSPRHHLTVVVDNYFCIEGLMGSCAKGIIVTYGNTTATLNIAPDEERVESTLNQVVVKPPYEDQGIRFQTTGYIVSIYISEIRSQISLSPLNTLTVTLAMEHFENNTQGQCGVCGGGSCVRRGGQVEEDSCCEKTAYDWVIGDPLKPDCRSAPRDVPCHLPPTTPPTSRPNTTTTTIPTTTTPPCPGSPLCDLFQHPVFAECRQRLNLSLSERNCRYDSCQIGNMACSSLEHAADECKKVDVCVDWRSLTNGTCNVNCSAGLIYSECRSQLDSFCRGGELVPGQVLEGMKSGCFCPVGLLRSEQHRSTCVSPPCSPCKGPLGEPKQVGESWKSNCHMCTCNNQTKSEECVPLPPPPAPLCSGSSQLLPGCCNEQVCVEKICSHDGMEYRVGDTWTDPAQPCVSYSCTRNGVQTSTRVCPKQNCPQERRVWDDRHCCYSCNQTCAPRLSFANITLNDCSATLRLPICEGQCDTETSWVLVGGLIQVEQCQCCREQNYEWKNVSLACAEGPRQYRYQHITSCHCKGCPVLR